MKLLLKMQGKYKYQLESDYNYFNPRLIGITLNEKWATISKGVITVKQGYCWDGCTWSPDFKNTYYASLIHDTLYQYHVDKKVADLVFLDIMKRDGFALRKIYYYAVKWFGVQT